MMQPFSLRVQEALKKFQNRSDMIKICLQYCPDKGVAVKRREGKFKEGVKLPAQALLLARKIFPKLET